MRTSKDAIHSTREKKTWIHPGLSLGNRWGEASGAGAAAEVVAAVQVGPVVATVMGDINPLEVQVSSQFWVYTTHYWCINTHDYV